MGFSTPSLKGKALQWLAQREHSRAELQDKLLRHAASLQRRAASTPTQAQSAGGGTESTLVDSHLQDESLAEAAQAQLRAEISRTLDELAAAGFQSDTRTAQSLARRHAQRYGSHRLKQGLQAKGLDSELIAQTLGEARLTELERARDVWQRRFGEPPQDRAEQARQARFLSARGFDADVVRRVLRGPQDSD
jgi:regulatory protein